MTQRRYRNIIEREIQRLNDKIDSKIVSGIGYSDDARRHKMLRRLAASNGRKRSFWGRAMQFVSIF